MRGYIEASPDTALCARTMGDYRLRNGVGDRGRRMLGLYLRYAPKPDSEMGERLRRWVEGKAGRRQSALMRYDGHIMMSRTQITLDPEIQRRARRRASDMGVSLAEYVRRLVARDLGSSQAAGNPTAVFDLGASGGSDIARNKDAMIFEALASKRHNRRGR